ncbi:UMP kinase [Candidatus Uhrbacteria bacterium]|nr:UMP kinase [Candidatus Uhrbacteria bacterium]MBD3283889.1 UMP kinase [Candidatus Uhrbacteria bacterium]
MHHDASRIHVLSIGGSLVVPKQGIDITFLKALRRFVVKEVNRGKRFILVIGGGMTARRYQHAANAVVKLDDEDVDWLGIHATRINAHLLRTIFRDIALHKVIKDPSRKLFWNKQVLIAAGWKPGWSTDYIAVRLAKRFGVKRVINLSNIDCVYDRDPYLHEGAKKITAIAWKDFRKIVGSTWEPGANAPFDPIASKLAEKEKMEVLVAGKDLANVTKMINGSAFRGTRIYSS